MDIEERIHWQIHSFGFFLFSNTSTFKTSHFHEQYASLFQKETPQVSSWVSDPESMAFPLDQFLNGTLLVRSLVTYGKIILSPPVEEPASSPYYPISQSFS